MPGRQNDSFAKSSAPPPLKQWFVPRRFKSVFAFPPRVGREARLPYETIGLLGVYKWVGCAEDKRGNTLLEISLRLRNTYFDYKRELCGLLYRNLISAWYEEIFPTEWECGLTWWKTPIPAFLLTVKWPAGPRGKASSEGVTPGRPDAICQAKRLF